MAHGLREKIEGYLTDQGASLSYALIIEQLFCICERDSRILESMKGFTRIDTGVNPYVKPLQPDVSMTDAPVAMTGFDM